MSDPRFDSEAFNRKLRKVLTFVLGSVLALVAAFAVLKGPRHGGDAVAAGHAGDGVGALGKRHWAHPIDTGRGYWRDRA